MRIYYVNEQGTHLVQSIEMKTFKLRGEDKYVVTGVKPNKQKIALVELDDKLDAIRFEREIELIANAFNTGDLNERHKGGAEIDGDLYIYEEKILKTLKWFKGEHDDEDIL